MVQLRGKKYSGTLYARAWGTTGAFHKMGNVTELTTSKESDDDKLPSTGRDDYGETIDVDSKSGGTELSLKFNSFDKQALARALMGEAVDLNTEPEDFTDVPLTVTLGWIDVGYDDIDPESFALEDDQGGEIDATTYQLNPRMGMVEFNDTSELEPDTQIKATGKTKGSAGYQIEANTLTSLPLEMKLDGKDRISKKDGQLIIPHAVLSAEGDINWFADDWWESGLSGALVKDEGKPTMLFKEYY